MFHRVKFSDDANFESATFIKYALFPGAQFLGGSTHFDQANFGDLAYFDRATFRSPVLFVDNPASSKAAPMRFSYTRFETAPPWFHGRKMHEDTDWTDAVWPEIRDDPHLIKADIRAYERLRVIAHDLGNVHDAHLFFRKEMASARKIAPWHARPFYTLYEILSDYGHSYLRPLVAIFMLWLSYAVFYTIYFLSKTANFDTVVLRQTMSEAAGLSFANIFAFFGFERRFSQMDWRVEPDWLIALTGFETVFGFVLLFFFGLGLRNRFRLG